MENRQRKSENTRELETEHSDISLHSRDSSPLGNCSYPTAEDSIVLRSMQWIIDFMSCSSIFMEFIITNLFWFGNDITLAK